MTIDQSAGYDRAHTAACRAARAAHHHQLNGPNDVTPDWPMMHLLSVDEQQAVLKCGDESHDSVRSFLRGKPWVSPWGAMIDRTECG